MHPVFRRSLLLQIIGNLNHIHDLVLRKIHQTQKVFPPELISHGFLLGSDLSIADSLDISL